MNKENKQQQEQILDYLIGYLLNEDKRYKGFIAPDGFDEKLRILRSLMNVRMPKPIGNDFVSTQDELLQSVIAEKGITDVADLKPIKDGLYLWRGDITTLKVDAIVNAANSGMLGCFEPCHSCIDNAIHSYAGVQLRLSCADIMERQGEPEATGRAKITFAYNLPSKYILHTVGPIVSGKVTDEDRLLLAGCYRSCLELSEQNEIKSVAFCCISTGVFHFPNEEAAEIAVKTVSDFLIHSSQIKKVVFNVFTERDEQIYKRLLG